MLLNRQRIVEQLEEGYEFCGHCGADITDKPDCIHRNQGGAVTSTSEDRFIHNRGVLLYLRPIRVGMEYLLYEEDLLNLPIFDPILKSNCPPAAELYKMNEYYKGLNFSLPVFVWPRSTETHQDITINGSKPNGDY